MESHLYFSKISIFGIKVNLGKETFKFDGRISGDSVDTNLKKDE
jgi:hypothetical protein